MDNTKIYDLKCVINNFRKEINLIRDYLAKCYLKPEIIYISLEDAQEYFTIFVTDKDIAKKLKKNRQNMVIFSDLLDILEQGFRYIEEYQAPYLRWSKH